MDNNRIDSKIFSFSKALFKKRKTLSEPIFGELSKQFIKQCILLDFFETYLKDFEARIVNEESALGTSSFDKATAIVTLGLIKNGFETAVTFADSAIENIIDK